MPSKKSKSTADLKLDTEMNCQLQDLDLKGHEYPCVGSRGVSSPLPYRSWQHGNDLVHVVVGSDLDSQHTFTFHRDLLARRSLYFEKALCSHPSNPVTTLTLPHDCPISFEVVYQWLYTGKLYTDSFYQFNTPRDVFWLRALKTAEYVKLRDLATDVYRTLITDVFHSKNNFEPSEVFIHELYKPARPGSTDQLRRIIVAQTAYVMIRDHDHSSWSQATWNSIFALEPEFSLRVLQQLSRLRANDRNLFKDSATADPNFSIYGLK